jgi:inosine-uridine nucleoside N-ribohydrolase
MKNVLFFVFILIFNDCVGQARIILDTDIDSDVDDVQALAMLHSYQNRRVVDLIGVIVTSNDSNSFKCVDAINTFYKNPDIPIGFLKTQSNLQHVSKYTLAISKHFQNNITFDQTVESAKLYRKLLAESPDNSVIIVTIGHLTSLQRLLQSNGDSISSATGKELVEKKVKKWLCMGGQFPSGQEANFYRPDAQSTRYCLENWSKEVTFCGWEVGNQIITGGEYFKKKLQENNPVYKSYKLYNDFIGRPAWDQVAVLLLDKKAKLYFDFETNGHVSVNQDGSNFWINKKAKDKDHAFVKIKNSISPNAIAKYIDDLVILNQP